MARNWKTQEGKNVPHCRQEKRVLRVIEQYFHENPGVRPSGPFVIALYVGMTQIASDDGSDVFQASKERLSQHSLCDQKTIQRSIQILEKLKVISVNKSPGLTPQFELLTLVPQSRVADQIDPGPTVQGLRDRTSNRPGTHSPDPLHMVGPTVSTRVVPQSPPSIEELLLEEHKEEQTPLLNSPLSKKGTIPFEEIIGLMNEISGKHFRLVDSNKEPIRARWNDGYSKEDFLKVIRKKWNHWQGTKWEQYFRPETLFAKKKFDGYLNQPDSIQDSKSVGYMGDFNDPERF